MGLEKKSGFEEPSTYEKESRSNKILARKGYQVKEIINDTRVFFGLEEGKYDEKFIQKLEEFQRSQGFPENYIDGILGEQTLIIILKHDKQNILGSSNWTNKSNIYTLKKKNGIYIAPLSIVGKILTREKRKEKVFRPEGVRNTK